MRKTKLKKSFFTIVELMVAMAIFAILMLILMQIFNSTQDVWKRTTVKSDSYGNARIALNMIEADLMSAIYVDNPTGIGRSFYTDNSTVLWFPTIKPYLIDEDQKLKEVEVTYYLDSTSYTDEISGLGGLRRLKYSVRTDKDGLTFRTATSTVSNKTDRGIILENILSWTIAPLYRNASNNYKPVTDRMPHIVLVSFTVIDNDPQIMRKYKNATSDEERGLYTRTFSRIISIDRPIYYADL